MALCKGSSNTLNQTVTIHKPEAKTKAQPKSA
jgi:hypothetical protein